MVTRSACRRLAHGNAAVTPRCQRTNTAAACRRVQPFWCRIIYEQGAQLQQPEVDGMPLRSCSTGFELHVHGEDVGKRYCVSLLCQKVKPAPFAKQAWSCIAECRPARESGCAFGITVSCLEH